MTEKFSAKEEIKKMDEYYPNSDLSFHYKKNREQIVVLLDAIESIWEKETINDEQYTLLLNGLRASWSVVWFYVVGVNLIKMYGHIPKVDSLLSDAMSDRSWQTRFNTICVIEDLKDGDFKYQILKSGLNDKSKRVREMTTEKVIFSCYKKLYPQVLELIKDFDEWSQNFYVEQMEISDRGYILEPEGNASSITTRVSVSDIEKYGEEGVYKRLVEEEEERQRAIQAIRDERNKKA